MTHNNKLFAEVGGKPGTLRKNKQTMIQNNKLFFFADAGGKLGTPRKNKQTK